MDKYIILRELDPLFLHIAVNKLIEQGYKPIGGMILDKSEKSCYYLQTLYRERGVSET